MSTETGSKHETTQIQTNGDRHWVSASREVVPKESAAPKAGNSTSDSPSKPQALACTTAARSYEGTALSGTRAKTLEGTARRSNNKEEMNDIETDTESPTGSSD